MRYALGQRRVPTKAQFLDVSHRTVHKCSRLSVAQFMPANADAAPNHVECVEKLLDDTAICNWPKTFYLKKPLNLEIDDFGNLKHVGVFGTLFVASRVKNGVSELIDKEQYDVAYAAARERARDKRTGEVIDAKIRLPRIDDSAVFAVKFLKLSDATQNEARSIYAEMMSQLAFSKLRQRDRDNKEFKLSECANLLQPQGMHVAFSRMDFAKLQLISEATIAPIRYLAFQMEIAATSLASVMREAYPIANDDQPQSETVEPPVPLSPSAIKYVLRGVINGVTYLHDAKIIHRDLKPENILLGFNGEVLICDPGEAAFDVDPLIGLLDSPHGSRNWSSARLQQRGGSWYSFEADWWPCGIMGISIGLQKQSLPSYQHTTACFVEDFFDDAPVVDKHLRNLSQKLISVKREDPLSEQMFLEHEFFANEPDWTPAGKAEIKRRVVEARSGNSTTDLKLHADYKKFVREVPRNFCLPRKQLQASEEVEELENEDDEAEVSYWNAELGHFALLPGTVFITDAEGLRQIRSHLPAKLRRLSNFAICARLSKLALKGILHELAPDQRANANEATQTDRRRKKWQRATVVQSFAKVVAAESDKDFKLKLQKIGVTMAAYLECYKNRRYDGVQRALT